MNKSLILGLLVGGALIAVGVAGSRPANRQTPDAAPTAFAIQNVRVFDGEKTIARTNVVVRDGSIVSVGGTIPGGVHTIKGEGRTLLPGLIDAHTHVFGDALNRALVFGVTTELDMFTEHRFADSMRKEQAQAGGALTRADLYSAGTLITAPGGHGTEYGLRIPTLENPAHASAFVDARIAEGSDYIKIVYDDGASYGRKIPTISRSVLQAAIAAARKRDKMALVHIGSRGGAEDAISAGASGLIHLFADAPADEALVARIKRARAFVTPTLTVIHSTSGVAGSGALVDDSHISSFITAAERTALEASFPKRAQSKINPSYALAAVKQLHDAGVPLLAGTDAPNPGTSHGASMHRELELLVKAGLSPEAALAAATSVPARVFELADRGQIATGKRADLLLVEGDPTRDILATRNIVSIWKRGVRFDRPTAPAEPAAADAPTSSGIVSGFDGGEPRAEFGAGWQVSTDSMMGGKSKASMKIVEGGANQTRGALEVTGAIAAGAPYPWAGAMFFPAATPMSPVNLSRFKEIVFWARGDGGEHQVMMFASRLGQIPATHAFTAGPEWREFAVPFSAFSGIDGADIRGVLFSAGAKPGVFSFVIDEVKFR